MISAPSRPSEAASPPLPRIDPPFTRSALAGIAMPVFVLVVRLHVVAEADGVVLGGDEARLPDGAAGSLCVPSTMSPCTTWAMSSVRLLLPLDLQPAEADDSPLRRDGNERTARAAIHSQIKLALRVARKYGCVLESTLPMRGGLSSLSTEAFYARAAKCRIGSYHNLGRDPERWRAWISNQGPVRVVVDRTWERHPRHRHGRRGHAGAQP